MRIRSFQETSRRRSSHGVDEPTSPCTSPSMVSRVDQVSPSCCELNSSKMLLDGVKRRRGRPISRNKGICWAALVAMTALLCLGLSSLASLKRRSLLSRVTHTGPGNTTAVTVSANQSAIPRILIFTHSMNLLTARLEHGVNTSIEQYNELVVLQRNVQRIIALHPEAHVRFLTDDDCQASIRTFFPDPHEANELVRYFINEPHGMYKADLCRGTALYETGGIYLDVDVGVRLPLWDVVHPWTQFATVRVHGQSHYPGAFFQAFIAATPRHDVIRRYVQLFLQFYRGTVHLQPPNGPIGVLLLKRAHDEIQHEQEQLLNRQRVSLRHITPVRRTALNATTELWQEILYAPQLQHSLLAHVPPPTWGTRRACKFVVATSPRLPLVVPLYSRIAGSRMCPETLVNTSAFKYTRQGL